MFSGSDICTAKGDSVKPAPHTEGPKAPVLPGAFLLVWPLRKKEDPCRNVPFVLFLLVVSLSEDSALICVSSGADGVRTALCPRDLKRPGALAGWGGGQRARADTHVDVEPPERLGKAWHVRSL